MFEVDQNGISLLAGFDTAGKDTSTAKTRRGQDEVFQDICLPVLGWLLTSPYLLFFSLSCLHRSKPKQTVSHCFIQRLLLARVSSFYCNTSDKRIYHVLKIQQKLLYWLQATAKTQVLAMTFGLPFGRPRDTKSSRFLLLSSWIVMPWPQQNSFERRQRWCILLFKGTRDKKGIQSLAMQSLIPINVSSSAWVLLPFQDCNQDRLKSQNSHPSKDALNSQWAKWNKGV